MKKLILIISIFILLPSCTHLWQSGSTISDDFVYMGKPDKSFCLTRCEKYGIKKYGQIHIDKAFVTVDDRKYFDPWCICMESCLQLDAPYCKEDSTVTN